MKANKPLLSLMFLIIILLLKATNGFCAQSVSIDTAIMNGATYFEQQLQKNISIVVINVGSDSLKLSEYIIDELSSRFVNGKNFTVVDRKNPDAVQQENNNQLWGEVSDRTAQSIGQKIGVQNVILGNIQPFGNEYRLDLRALSVMLGTYLGNHIGPGVLLLDLRYIQDLKGTEYETSAANLAGAVIKTPNTTRLWSMFEFSIGYEIGIFKKKRRYL